MLNDLDCSISYANMIHKEKVNLVLRARPGAVVYIGLGSRFTRIVETGFATHLVTCNRHLSKLGHNEH